MLDMLGKKANNDTLGSEIVELLKVNRGVIKQNVLQLHL